MICFPNSKINIGLFITARRNDGYHDLETIFFPLSRTHKVMGAPPDVTYKLNDVLEIVPATTGVSAMHMSGLSVAGDTHSNLVWKALEMINTLHPGKLPPLDIYLHKATPMGAGLGGGSADGAFMLALLNDYGKLGMPAAQLEELALQLGSDCPFFIRNTPQFASGRGEHMRPVSLNLDDYEIRVVCSPLHVSTREAFSRITPRPAPFALADIAALPIAEWKHYIANDFEQSVFALYPQLAATKQRLYQEGAVYAALTGTGSAVYGIFPRTAI